MSLDVFWAFRWAAISSICNMRMVKFVIFWNIQYICTFFIFYTWRSVIHYLKTLAIKLLLHLNIFTHSFGNIFQIPYGKKLDKAYILRTLCNLSEKGFVPVNVSHLLAFMCLVDHTFCTILNERWFSQYHFEGNAAIFYVEDLHTGLSLEKYSKQISSPDGFKVCCPYHFQWRWLIWFNHLLL